MYINMAKPISHNMPNKIKVIYDNIIMDTKEIDKMLKDKDLSPELKKALEEKENKVKTLENVINEKATKVKQLESIIGEKEKIITAKDIRIESIYESITFKLGKVLLSPIVFVVNLFKK